MQSNRTPASTNSIATIWWVIVLTLVIEAVTCILRFGFGLQSPYSMSPTRYLTFGIRIHHGYWGVLMVALALLWPKELKWRVWVFRIGMALLLSDLIHHFLVLWPITGDPQFDLVYPPLDTAPNTLD